MADCSCSNFPATLGNVTFGAKVGIGTTNPGGQLDVAGNYLALDNGDYGAPRGIRFRNTTDTTTPNGGGLYQANNDQVYIQAGAANNINFRDSSLTVLGGISDSGMNILVPTSVSGNVSIKDVSSVTQIAFSPGASSYLASGSLGIGTTTPSYPLDVTGTARVGEFILNDTIRNATGQTIADQAGCYYAS